MSLVRFPNRTPVVRLPEPLPPEPHVLAMLQDWADRDGRVYRMRNGFVVKPRPKRVRWKGDKPKPGWWLRGETSE